MIFCSKEAAFAGSAGTTRSIVLVSTELTPSLFFDILHAYRPLSLLLQFEPVLVGEVKVYEPLLWRICDVPCDREQTHRFFGNTETSARIF